MPKVTSKDGTTIAYDKKGQGPLVILVLGALNKRGSGKKLTEQLVNHFTVISYDRRGRGDSTAVEPYSVEKEVEDLQALINENGGSAFLYGHSSGAILALLAAKQLGKQVKAVAVYELPYNSDSAAIKLAENYRKELQGMLHANQYDEAVALFITSVGVTEKQIEAMKRLPMWKGLTAMAPTLAHDTIRLMEIYPETSVRDIQAPVLVLYGAASPSFMHDTALNLSNNLSDAKLLALEKQTHDVKASVLAPHLINFFK